MQELQGKEEELERAQAAAAAARHEVERLRAAEKQAQQLEADVRTLKAQLASAIEVTFYRPTYDSTCHDAHNLAQLSLIQSATLAPMRHVKTVISHMPACSSPLQASPTVSRSNEPLPDSRVSDKIAAKACGIKVLI